MNNLTYGEFVGYVDEVGIEQAENDISSLRLASRLSGFFLVVFVIILHVIAVLTARNLQFTLRFSLISGLTPVVGPVYLIVKIAFMQSFSAIILALALLPCIVMSLYHAGVRRKCAYLHNAICMVAEKMLVPEDSIDTSIFQISKESTKESQENDNIDKVVAHAGQAVFNNVVIDDVVIEEPEDQSEVDRLIDEILGGKK